MPRQRIAARRGAQRGRKCVKFGRGKDGRRVCRKYAPVRARTSRRSVRRR